jgi:DNA-binding LacI/PurR family transcriptional regulator
MQTVDHRLAELGQYLAQSLLALIEGESERIRKSIEPRLVERDSHALRTAGAHI